MTKRVSTTPEVAEFRARYRQIPVRGFFWGQAKFGDRATYGLGAISVCTHTDTRTHTHTHTHTHKAINIIVLAGPAIFRGRLRAFGKCIDGVASSKGRLNLDCVQLIV